MPTLRLKTWNHRKFGNSGERKWKARTRALYSVPSLKIRFYSYLVENSQKATLNFYFKSRFSVKPSKFQIYFAKDCKQWPELKWNLYTYLLSILLKNIQEPIRNSYTNILYGQYFDRNVVGSTPKYSLLAGDVNQASNFRPCE